MSSKWIRGCFVAGAIATASFVWAGCADQAGDDAGLDANAAIENNQASRGPIGKADRAGSCQDYCGEFNPPNQGCFCDDECMDYGDCCDDYIDWCAMPTGVEGRCVATGGAWEDGTCECAQDGASLDYVFDPINGCGPAAEDDTASELCETTGGAWENGDCECAQDGASIHFEFHPMDGCGLPSDEDLAMAVAHVDMQALIAHYGANSNELYYIERPGVIDHVFGPYENIDALMTVINDERGWGQIMADAGPCPILEDGEAPANSCEEEDHLGQDICYITTVSGYYRASGIMQTQVEFEFNDYSDDEINAMQNREHNILKIITDMRHGVSVSFIRDDEQWKVFSVDVAKYDCSA